MTKITKGTLDKMTLSELKDLAREKNIKFDSKIKKSELVQLLSTSSDKKNATKKVKKEKVTIDKKKLNKATLIDEPSNEAEKFGEKQQNFEYKQQDSFKNISSDLPESYGEDRFFFLPIDPYKGFLYWDLSEQLLKNFGLNSKRFDKVLRVYDATRYFNGDTSDYLEIAVNRDADNWYLDFKAPDKKYIAELGFLKDGKFIVLLISNVVYVPRDSVSDQIDEKWMLNNEKYKMLLDAAGVNILFKQDGSFELMKFIAGNISGSVSSGFNKK